VTVTGQPGAKVKLTIDGHQWKTVTLSNSGSRTVNATSTDVVGLLGDVARTLGASNIKASYV